MMVRKALAGGLVVALASSIAVLVAPTVAFASCSDSEAIWGGDFGLSEHGQLVTEAVTDRDLACSDSGSLTYLEMKSTVNANSWNHIGWGEFPGPFNGCTATHCFFIFTHGEINNTDRCANQFHAQIYAGDYPQFKSVQITYNGSNLYWDMEVNLGTGWTTYRCKLDDVAGYPAQATVRNNSGSGTGMYTSGYGMQYKDYTGAWHSWGTVPCNADPDGTWLFDSGTNSYLIHKTGGVTC